MWPHEHPADGNNHSSRFLSFALIERSSLQRHKTWSLSHTLKTGEDNSSSCESGMGWDWMSVFETSSVESARPQSDFLMSSQQKKLLAG